MKINRQLQDRLANYFERRIINDGQSYRTDDATLVDLFHTSRGSIRRAIEGLTRRGVIDVAPIYQTARMKYGYVIRWSKRRDQ